MTGPPALELLHLTRRFGDLVAVDDVSLTVPRGTFLALLGPNGAGKTTLLRMLTGLLAPTSGEARLCGLSITAEPLEVKRRIGVVPDDLALFDRLSLVEHLSLAGPLYGLSRGETAARAESLLRFLDLWEVRGTLAAEASTGMRKKTSVAMALIHAPEVLFLDEPFEGIDPVGGESLRRLLLDLAGRGTTIVLTSHILEIVEHLAERVAIVARGRIARDVGMRELGARPGALLEAFKEVVGAPPEARIDLPWLR